MMNDQRIEKLIDMIKYRFDNIRGDWSDPRYDCRMGWEAVAHLQELLFN